MKSIGRLLVLSVGVQLTLAPSARSDEKTPGAIADGSGNDGRAGAVGNGRSNTGAGAGTVNASTDARSAYADHLFQEGLLLMKSDNCPQAVLKFQSSEQLDPSAATLMNLATCYAHLGRTASAWRTYREAVALAAKEGNDELRENAFKGIYVLTPTLTKLKVIPPRDGSLVALTLNGEPLGADDGLPIALDPGENIVEATVAGRGPWRRTVNATDVGTTIVIEVPEAEGRHEGGDAAGKWRAVALAAGVVGVAGIVTSVVLGLNAKATHEEATRYCTVDSCNATGRSLWEDANRKATLATYAFGLGLLFTAGGAGIWFVSGQPSKPAIGLTPLNVPGRPALGVNIAGAL